MKICDLEPYNGEIDPNIIDKINAIGCTSFKYEVVKERDKVYIIPVGDKKVKIVISDNDEWEKES